MRGNTIKIGEYYSARYYDIIPKIENNEVVTNGKIEYVIDTQPYYFTYREREVREMGSTTSYFRGYKQQLNNLGVYQTSKNVYSIYTSNTSIPFKNGGQVVITINGVDFKYTIQQVRVNTLYQNNITMLRYGGIDSKHCPILLDLI